jgi:hypothetical protein
MKKLISYFLATLVVFFAGAQQVMAQWDYDGYDYTDYSGTSSDAGFLGTLFSGMGIFVWVVWCCAIIISLAFFVFRVIMLVHAIKNAPEDDKTLWILLLIFVPLVPFIYFFTKKKEWDPKKESK